MSKKLFTLTVLALVAVAFAQDTETTHAAVEMASPYAALGKGLGLGLAAIGTGIAQAAIGAAALGAVAEDRRNLGNAFIFFLLPETLVIFGFVGLFLIK